MSLLDTIEALMNARPLGRDVVESQLDVALRGDPNNTNRYIELLRSFRNAPGIKAVELRLPLPGAMRKDGMLIVDLDPVAGDPVSGSDVRTRFGDAPEVDVPLPDHPAGRPHYLSYAKPWGALRFGFHDPSLGVLSSFVIDVER